MRSFLITGAAGFLGSSLCEALLEMPDVRIVGLDNFNDFYDPEIKRRNIGGVLASDRFTLVEGDIRDEGGCRGLFSEYSFDVVIHLAAMAGVRPSIQDPGLYMDVNVTGTLNLLGLSAEFGVQKFLFASSSSVYGNNEKAPFSETDFVDHPISPYAVSKKAGELLCYNSHHLSGLPVACLRFFTVYGPRQRPEMAIHKFTRMIDSGETIPVFNRGECYRDYTYVDDICQGIIAVLNREFAYDVVNIGGSQTTSTLDLIRMIESGLGKNANLDLLPAQPGDVERTFADVSHIRDEYGFSPTTDIESGVGKFIDWYRCQV